MTERKIVFGILTVFLLVMLQFWYFGKRQKEEFLRRAKKEFGKVPNRNYEAGEFSRIERYYRNRKEELSIKVDDITWNDLDLDRIFQMLNHTYSSIGEEYLYYLLRAPQMEEKELEERERLITFFLEEESVREKLYWFFHRIGKMRRYSLSDVVEYAMNAKDGENWVHYLAFAAIIISILLLFVQPVLGVFGLIVSMSMSIITYYREKGTVELYYSSIRQVVGMISLAEEMEHLSIPGLEPYTESLKNARKVLAPVKRNIWILGGSTESILDAILDYIRLITHIDLIKYHATVKLLKKEKDSVKLLMDRFGYLESMLAIASYRKSQSVFCVPKLKADGNVMFSVQEMAHPLITSPVRNTIYLKKGALITGANASGKSTFLKTAAINAVLAQTIHTVSATSYCASYFSVMSSMALTDNLCGKESYYIVEIRSLKRILDEVEKGIHILCFVDEVLRGTNTVERIAASAQVLKSLTKKNVICFAATHDLELTQLLEKEYENYHFQEEVSKDDIRFDYKLYKGRAVSRNAIKLLSIIGYEPRLIEHAERSAQYFLDTGIWKA